MQFEQLGPYRLGKKLGQGGMGAVYAAVDVDSGEPAAVKILSPLLAAEEGFRVRFEAEIESLKKLRHPNIVRLYGYGEQEGCLFYGMELVNGGSLEDEIRAGRRFEWREVTQLTIKLCRALKHAHDHGVIHRDIKPANLMLSTEGEIKLSDFGIARLFGNTRMTSDGGVLGTAEYMAPEQADGRPVTDRCDQYSLGGVMYALLAGRPPFRASSLLEMLQLQRFAEPQPVRRYAPDTPTDLDRIILQLLEKDPQRRFSNTLLLAKALEAMERGLSIASSRDDFVIADVDATLGDNTPQKITGFDPLAATLVPQESTDEPAAASVTPLSAMPLSSTPPGDYDPATDLDGNGRAVPTRGVSDRTSLYTAGDARAPREALQPPPPTTRFTKVTPASDERPAWYREAFQGLLSPQSLVLCGALAALVLAGAYLMQPPSADTLFQQIRTAAESGKSDDLKGAESAMDNFLSRYADDPRAPEVTGYKEELAMVRAEDKTRRQAGLKAKVPQELSPVERVYREALDLEAFQPEQALAHYQALVDLYADVAESSATDKETLEVARRQIERLPARIAKAHEADLAAIEARLAAARELSGSDPAAARRIYQSVVELYGDKPWAAAPVTTARDEMTGTAATDK